MNEGEPRRDIYQEVAHQIIKGISEQDLIIIYEILKRSDPTSFEEALDKTGRYEDDLQDNINRIGEKFYMTIVNNFITIKLESWIGDVFGEAVYRSLVHSSSDHGSDEQRNGIDVFRESEMSKVLQDFNWTDDNNQFEKLVEILLELKKVFRI